MVVRVLLNTVENIANSFVQVANARARALTRIAQLVVILIAALVFLLILLAVASFAPMIAFGIIGAALFGIWLYSRE